MALDEKAISDALESDEPNRPARLAMSGTTGPRDLVPRHIQRRRREAMSSLLAAPTSIDGIIEIMSAEKTADGSPGFAMTEAGVRKLIREVYATWQEDDAESAQHYKAAAIRRLARHVQQAKTKGAWTAVAMMEKTLMDIQGTAEPIEVNLTGEVRLNHSLMSVIGETDPVDVRRMIDAERARIQAESPSVVNVPIVDAVGETVARKR